jgi:hypothetical protein
MNTFLCFVYDFPDNMFSFTILDQFIFFSFCFTKPNVAVFHSAFASIHLLYRRKPVIAVARSCQHWADAGEKNAEARGV